MNKPYMVGVTGGIGAGKSLVCKIFSTLGIPIYNADDRAKVLMNDNQALKGGIISIFGTDAYKNDQLNRSFISKQVFVDEGLLQQLNAIVHPAVGEDFNLWVNQHLASPYLIKEAAIMFESSAWKELDSIVNVQANTTTRIKRVLERDRHRSEKDIRAIMDNQMSDDERSKRADHVITNEQEDHLIPQVLSLHNLFLQRG